jgi:hypothetical protein
MEQVQIPWKSTKDDGLPKKPGVESYEQVQCLVITNFGTMCILTWNCEHNCWDDEDGDDYAGDPDSVRYYIPLSQIRKP